MPNPLRHCLSFAAPFLALTLLTVPARADNDVPDPAVAWELLARGLINDAHTAFVALSGPSARLGEAFALLQRQPLTPTNLERAETLFTALIGEPDAEISATARYQLARIPHTHRTTPDLALARQRYLDLIAAHPGHLLAERAHIKLAIIDLYRVEPRLPRGQLLANYTATLATLTDSGVRRDLALLLAEARLRFEVEPALALDLLLKADAAGFARSSQRATAWIQIAELARLAGQVEIAHRYYRQFLAHFPRDARYLEIEERLAALPPLAALPAEPASSVAALLP